MKARPRVDASNDRLQLALQWHCRHTIVRNWCTKELRAKLGFEEPDLDNGIADVSYDTRDYLPLESGNFF